MITKTERPMVWNRQILIWRGGSSRWNYLRMVHASHRDLANDFSRLIVVVFWRSGMSNRDRRRRQVDWAQHRNNFSVLVVQPSVIGINANHSRDYKEQCIDYGGEENKRTAAFEFPGVRTRFNQVIKHLFLSSSDYVAGAMRVCSYSETLDSGRGKKFRVSSSEFQVPSSIPGLSRGEPI
jgi:hypothetical protein